MTGPNSEAVQVFYGTIPAICAILLAQWISNKRSDDLFPGEAIDDPSLITANGFAQVNARLEKLEDRVGDLERRSPLVRS